MLKILFGDNTFLRQQRLEAIKTDSKLKPVIISSDSLASSQFIDFISSQSLFSTEQFLIIYDLKTNSNVWQTMIDRSLQIQNDSTISLILVEDNLDGRTKFVKEAQNSGLAEEFKLPKENNTMAALHFIKQQAIGLKMKIDSSTALQLLDRVGPSPWNQFQALNILAVLGKNDQATIETYVPNNPMSNIFGVLELSLKGKQLSMKRELDQLMELDTDPRLFFGLLTSQLLNLLAVKTSEGVDISASELNIHPYMYSKSISLARSQSLEKMKAVIKIFSDTDAKLKTSQFETWDIIVACLYKVSSLSI